VEEAAVAEATTAVKAAEGVAGDVEEEMVAAMVVAEVVTTVADAAVDAEEGVDTKEAGQPLVPDLLAPSPTDIIPPKNMTNSRQINATNCTNFVMPVDTLDLFHVKPVGT
jgi:hypothetical protein